MEDPRLHDPIWQHRFAARMHCQYRLPAILLEIAAAASRKSCGWGARADVICSRQRLRQKCQFEPPAPASNSSHDQALVDVRHRQLWVSNSHSRPGCSQAVSLAGAVAGQSAAE
jgi:hypothetical protein